MRKGIVLAVVTTVALVTSEVGAFDCGPTGRWDGVPGGSWESYGTTRQNETDADTDYLTMNTIVGPEWDFGNWTCDDIKMLGQVSWYDTVPGWPGHQGLVGINNINGVQTISGSLTFHINNFLDERAEKWVWDEVYYYASPGATFLHTLAVGPPPPAGVMVTMDQKVNVWSISGTDNGMHENLDGTIAPNPPWEEVIFDFICDPGEEAYLDSFEVATICIPEPATLALLGLAGATAIALRRRR